MCYVTGRTIERNRQMLAMNLEKNSKSLLLPIKKKTSLNPLEYFFPLCHKQNRYKEKNKKKCSRKRKKITCELIRL
jgi:hypothetical protein